MSERTIEALVALAYSYCPKAPWYEREDGQRERERVLAAGRRAGANYEAWRAMHRRLRERLPECQVHDDSFYLLSPTSCDSCYWAELEVPVLAPEIGVHLIPFFVSTLAPYYVLFRERHVEVPNTMPKPSGDPEDGFRYHNAVAVQTRSFEMTKEDEPYASVLAEEIERTFGYELMPPEIGMEVVPDVVTGVSGLGTSTLYDCLFHHFW